MRDDVEPQPPSAGGFLTLFPSIMLPMFLAVVDQTIVATALPAIAASLGNVDRVSGWWCPIWSRRPWRRLCMASCATCYGGRRMMLIALSVFLVASLLCTLATSIEMLIFARVLQGLGGGGLMTLTQSLIGESVPPRERARYQGYLAAVMVTSSVFGPVVGGYLAHLRLAQHLPDQSAARRAGHAADAAAAGAADAEQAWVFDGSAGAVRPVHPADAGGAVSGPAAAPGSPAGSDRAGAGGRRCAVMLVRRERQAAFPLFPLTLLRQPTIWRSDALAACHGAALVSLVTFLPLYLHIAQGTSPAESGLLLLPLMFGIGTGSMVDRAHRQPHGLYDDLPVHRPDPGDHRAGVPRRAGAEPVAHATRRAAVLHRPQSWAR